MFQSLSGFLVRCNAKHNDLEKNPEMFQSLSGFLVRCNFPLGSQQPEAVFVSIPVGFSRSLQLGDLGLLF